MKRRIQHRLQRERRKFNRYGRTAHRRRISVVSRGAPICFGKRREVPCQRCSQPGIGGRQRRATHHHNEIQVIELPALAAEPLAYQALDAIPIDRPARLLLGYRQPKARAPFGSPSSGQYRKVAIGRATRGVENAFIFGG
jgi:hypothetical protein